MIERIKHNSATLRKFQAFEMRLLNLNSIADMVNHILSDAKIYFDLDIITLCLIDEKGEIVQFLLEDGYDCEASQDLIFLSDKTLLENTFGLSARSYIGAYKVNKCEEFFPQLLPKPSSVAITPLNRRGKYLGTLNLGSHQVGRFVQDMATDFVEHLASIVGVCLENTINFETIRRTSYIDTLTGVNNRRFLEQRIGEELDRCQRSVEPISCLFLDIDFFKSVNDTYGHQAGDIVLSTVAKVIKSQLRNNDVLARYGGEEFVALLSNINAKMSQDIAERIRKTIQALKIEYNNKPVPITISIGAATYVPESVITSTAEEVATSLIKSADSALYKAKHNGRNRVEYGEVISDAMVVKNTAFHS
jgi:diguanylate cyclase (GGDEF)-like protein